MPDGIGLWRSKTVDLIIRIIKVNGSLEGQDRRPEQGASVLGEAPVDVVFHLASLPGGAAEANPTLARRVNVDATWGLLDQCKAQVDAGGAPPVFVFASSTAVFGAMPHPVHDDTLPRPLMSYGAHKLIGELLVDDHSRRGWVDGRSLRLPGVLARPPAPTGQLSAFLSDVGLAQFAHLAFEFLDALLLGRRGTRAYATVALALAHPLAQRLARAANLAGD